MRVLGIETSCDETAAAVVEDGFTVLSESVRSQIDLHRPYGGPVPEIASRSHLEVVLPVIEDALARAGITLRDIDAVAVTNRPGLIGALLVGVGVAKAFALALRKPLVGVDHVAAHVYAAWMEKRSLATPAVALVVSGGHTTLFRFDDPFTPVEIGNTRDDACGECYDKVAALLKLGYPGGPVIDELAQQGRANAFAFKPPVIERKGAAASEGFDFSFSGLKTAVRYKLTGENKPSRPGEQRVQLVLDATTTRDLCASFQHAVASGLVAVTLDAAEEAGARSIVVGGGCAANSEIRRRFESAAAARGLELHLPSRALCTDNGVMIAGLGYHLLSRRGADDLTLDARANA